jgi:phage-related protein
MIRVRERGLSTLEPVLLVLDGTAYATSLSAFTSQDNGAESFAWSLPAVGEAFWKVGWASAAPAAHKPRTAATNTLCLNRFM